MKHKILTIAALFAVMVAMTGIAAADQINVYEPSTTNKVVSIALTPGAGVVTKDLEVSSFTLSTPPERLHLLTDNVVVISNPGGAAPSDIIINYKESGGSLGSQPYPWTQTASTGGSEILDVQFAAAAGAPVGAVYSIQITDSNGVTQSISVQIVSTNIPEFPTVAIPVAGALGLVFFFQQRKKKEE